MVSVLGLVLLLHVHLCKNCVCLLTELKSETATFPFSIGRRLIEGYIDKISNAKEVSFSFCLFKELSLNAAVF